jgi:cephalosporin hydroxylase
MDSVSIRVGGELREVDIYSEEGFRLLSDLWTRSGWQHKVSYEVTWLGMRIIQLPEDILMMQELIYKLRPDVVIETGVAHGGTAVFYASMLELIGKGRVVSVDIDIRKHNRVAIEAHPMSQRITLIEGDAVAPATVAKVRDLVASSETVLLALDSNHTREHVAKELEAYSRLVTPGSYVVVFDSVLDRLEDAPSFKDEWRGGSVARAIEDFLATHPEFEVDPSYNRLGATYCPNGFLRRRSI